MNHPTDDELLLCAYDELPLADATRVETHLHACTSCRDRLGELETARAALDAALPRPARTRRWIAAGLAAAAILATVLLMREAPDRTAVWQPTASWSATAGYVTGRTMAEIDAQLTRLEQEKSYALPN